MTLIIQSLPIKKTLIRWHLIRNIITLSFKRNRNFTQSNNNSTNPRNQPNEINALLLCIPTVTLWRSTILLWVRFGCLSTGECYGYGWILIWATLGRLRPLAGDTYCVYYYIYACVYTTLCDCTAYYYHGICIEVVLCMYHLYHTLTPHTWRTIPILHSQYITHITQSHYIHIWHTLCTLSIITLYTYNTLCCVGVNSSLAADRKN